MTETCLTKDDYKGLPSTLCTGCGHDLITNHIINAYLRANVSPSDVIKVSGIGCSSKLPAYFMSKSFAFNSMHGRMAPVATGIKIANPKMSIIGISGDGDTASIGIGGFVHLIRRNVPMVYIIANNGVYGLTKGQFSPTADKSSPLKNNETTPYDNIDLCTLSLEMGCGFVARSFVGNAKQTVSIIEAAIHHPGTAIIDIISPCITFNNHESSTKSYSHLKKHEDTMVMPNPCSDPMVAAAAIKKAYLEGKILTGLFYQDTKKQNILDVLGLSKSQLSDLCEKDIRPTVNDFASTMKRFR